MYMNPSQHVNFEYFLNNLIKGLKMEILYTNLIICMRCQQYNLFENSNTYLNRLDR